MTNSLVDFKKISSLSSVWLVSLEASLENVPKKGFFRLNHWRFSRKAKCLIVVTIVAVLLVSVFAFLPKQSVSRENVVPQSSDNSTATPSPAATNHSNGPAPSGIALGGPRNVGGVFSSTKPPGLIQSAQTLNSTVWVKVAANAWAYFMPGVGVDVNTGLPYAEGTSFTSFTDWDLGVYIQAVIDAQKMNLTATDGPWGSDARINMVLTFLENRTLNANIYPYQFYDATTGKNSSQSAPEMVDIVDTGRLFVALNNLINFNGSLAPRIDNIVYNTSPGGNRSNYVALVPGIQNDILTSTSIYSYYIDSGFASFWPTLLPNVPSTILDNIFSAGNITYDNVSLPEASILGDPLLCSVFELNNNDTRLIYLSSQFYLASEAYYSANATAGQFAAFSEGNGPSGYLWEWVVLPNGDTWKITGPGSSAYLNVNPIVYNKVAFSFLSLYNTTFARNMVVYLEQRLPDPSSGYADGADNSGNVVSGVGSNTNGLILDAALYAIQNNP